MVLHASPRNPGKIILSITMCNSRVRLKVETPQASKARVLLSPGFLTWDMVAGMAELAAKKTDKYG